MTERTLKILENLYIANICTSQCKYELVPRSKER